jgi:hypothetical protein
MRLGVVRIALDSLLEGVRRLLILVVSVEFFALFNQGLGLTLCLVRVTGTKRSLCIVVGIGGAITTATTQRY